MSRKSYFPIVSAANAVLAGAFLFLLQSALPAAAAQEPEPSSPVAAQDPQPPPPAAAQEPPTPPPVAAAQESQLPVTSHAKVKKVLTNDDLESSRSLMEQYLLDKEANEAAAAAQAAADALASEQALAGIKMPATAQETQRAIRDAHQDINDEKDAIDRLNKEFETAPDEQKAGIQREIDRHTAGVQTSQQELRALQDHLRQLNSRSLSGNSADSGKQPPQ
jgi:cytoskeletal protein RodZ